MLFLIPLLLFGVPVHLQAKPNAPVGFQELKSRLLAGAPTDWVIGQLKEMFTTPADHQYLDQLLMDQKAAGITTLRLQNIIQKDPFLEITTPGGKKYKIKRLKEDAIQVQGQTISLKTSAEEYINAFNRAGQSRFAAGLILNLPFMMFAWHAPSAEAQLTEAALAAAALAVGYRLLKPAYNMGQEARKAISGSGPNQETSLSHMVAEDWMVYLKRKCKNQSEEPNRPPYSQSKIFELLKELARRNPNIFDVVTLKPKGGCDQNHMNEIIKTEKLSETEGRNLADFCANEEKFLDCMKKYRDSSSEVSTPPATETEAPANK